ncbi:MAG: AraC family transcriptional regulator [Oscillospiraceae bacterium]
MMADFKHSFKASAQETLPLEVYNVGFQKCAPGYQWGPGARDHYLIHYIVSGSGRYQTGNVDAALGAGDAFLIYPDAKVCYRADERCPWEYYWVGFSGPSSALLLDSTGFSPEHPTLSPPLGDRLRRALLDIYKARGTGYADAVRMAGYLQAALALLMENAVPCKKETLDAYARRGAQVIAQNYSRPLTIEEIAVQVGVSRSHLYRSFRSVYNLSPSGYLADCRVRRACRLLLESELSIGAVATSVGLEDPLYFSRMFRRIVGCSPQQYRQKHA